MRWLRRIGIGLLVVLVLLLAWEPSRVAMQTLVLVPSLLGAGPQPLQLFSEARRGDEVGTRSNAGQRLVDLVIEQDRELHGSGRSALGDRTRLP